MNLDKALSGSRSLAAGILAALAGLAGSVGSAGLVPPIAWAQQSASTSASVTGSARVVLPDTAQIDGPRILLGEVARIDASDPDLSLRLDRVLVGLAPLPGQSRWLELGEVEQALALEGFVPGEIELEGAARTELTRTSQAIQERMVKTIIVQALAESLNVRQDQVLLTRLDIDGEPRVGGGKIRLSLLDLVEPKFNAPIPVQLMVYLDDVPTTRIQVIVQAAIAPPKQAEVTRKRAVTRTASRPGRRARGERLVRSGQPVEIALEGPGMRISAQGKARASGGLGDEIAVENVISGNVIHCVVIGAGKVLVEWNPINGLKGVQK